MKPIKFGAGPVRCRTCGALMRPTERIDGWPRRSVVYGAEGECVQCAASQDPDPAGQGRSQEPAPPPAPVPRRRTRRRFDYRPEALAICESCGKRYDPLDGTCGCND
ncbi:hypothetical protein [Actinomyces faecalis]|uniref:hypothetical protein n=1 Tax=Actinomyces faecalis TaxID=2722820 RepID=UPI0015529882|nr:hypothetical protein [Actinomyces faecalis]